MGNPILQEILEFPKEIPRIYWRNLWISNRRSMEHQGHTADFHRQLQDQVFKEIWQHREAGRAKLGYMCQHFLAQKVRMGAKINVDEFIYQIVGLQRKEGEKQIQSKNPKIIANGEFLLGLIEDIQEIAKEHGWFSENLLWEV